MQKNKQIKAILFLSIFSIFLMHQAFPHVHHEHNENTSSNVHLEKHQHNHTHQHGHHNPEKKNTAKSDVIGFLVGLHIHSFITDEIPVIRLALKKNKIVNKLAFEKITSTYFENIDSYGAIEKPVVFSTPINYFNLYFTKLDLRGPPCLG